jgi:hypothetical protein
MIGMCGREKALPDEEVAADRLRRVHSFRAKRLGRYAPRADPSFTTAGAERFIAIA